MAHKSIPETGAQHGDKVRCVDVTEGERHRWTRGKVYEVTASARSVGAVSDWVKADSKDGFMGPSVGYGATWELVK